MFDAAYHDLLVRGEAAARVKEYAEARRLLERVLEFNPKVEDRVRALYWLSEATPEPAQKRRLVEEALAYSPGDMRLRRSLALLKGELKAEDMVDPDHLAPAAPAAGAAKDPQRFVCPKCGGRMTFTPDGKTLACEYCATRPQSAPAAGPAAPGKEAAAAENFLVAMATRKGHLHPSQRRTFVCQGCGANFLLPPQQLSLTCPYCASAYVTGSADARELIDPTRIIPFALDAHAAQRALLDWLQKNAPAAEQIEPPQGIYLPVWSFEMAGIVPWRCLVQKERNRWEPETGQEIVYHAAVGVPASRRLNAACAAELRAFDLRRTEPFAESYLASWPAETYQVSLGDASLEARRWTYEFEQQSVRGRLLHQVRDLSFNSLQITVESFQLVLLPLWLSACQLGGARRPLAINGQNGHVRAN